MSTCLHLFLLLFSLLSFNAGATPETCTQSAAIREQRFVPIGGIDQWITITGDDCRKPVILMLHGGPGNPLSPYAASIYAGWERDFTLVQWDQRGAGRTVGRQLQAEGVGPDKLSDDLDTLRAFVRKHPLSLDLMTSDGIAVAEYVRARLGKRKLILMGGSWGSILGAQMALRRPDLFHVYIGAGQIVHGPRNEAASYAAVHAIATEQKDADALKMLAKIGAPPWIEPRNFGVLRRLTRKYEAARTDAPPAHWWKPGAGFDARMAAEYTAGEDYSFVQFVGWAGDGMASKVDLDTLGTTYKLPVHLVHGEHDLVATAGVARAYFDRIGAPDKSFVLLPRTGHDPNAAMVAAQLGILKNLRLAGD